MFWNKKKDNVSEIKEAVESKPVVMPKPLGVPQLDKIDIPSVAEPKVFAPLFVKVDKYKEVLQKLQKLKTTVSEMNSLMLIQRDIEKLASDVDSMLKNSVQEFSEITNQLDTELVRPQSFEPFIKDMGARKNEGQLKEVENEVAKIKEKLQTI
ncbi:MAG: hypothetical protein PHU12_02730 [Candidatus Aenigmarchaeota archaeon]|nr:hypothetical protein [Candidatus Aenigmarchaeota archaeon]